MDYKNCFENSVLISLRINPDKLMVHIIYGKISEAQNRQRRERQKFVPKISPWMASQQNVTACVVLICGLYHKLHYNLVQDMDGLLHLNNLLLLPFKKNQNEIKFVSFNAAWHYNTTWCIFHIFLGGTYNVWVLGFWTWVGSDKCLVIINGKINVILYME